jgi:hypothetical protein
MGVERHDDRQGQGENCENLLHYYSLHGAGLTTHYTVTS